MMVSAIAATAPELLATLEAAGLPSDDLTEPGRTFFRFAENGSANSETLGFGGLELYGENALLRSLVMLPPVRGKGLGRHAAALLLARAIAAGARTAYLLTTDAAPFFEGLGFKRVDRTTAPASILATRQASALCPATAVLMALPLLREQK